MDHEKSTKKYRYFSKNQNFRNSPGFKKIKIFAFLEFQNFWLFDFFLDDGKIFFTRNFFSFWIGRPAHVRVGRWRVGFLSVTASESQKYRKRFETPQNHKNKLRKTKKYNIQIKGINPRPVGRVCQPPHPSKSPRTRLSLSRQDRVTMFEQLIVFSPVSFAEIDT